MREREGDREGERERERERERNSSPVKKGGNPFQIIMHTTYQCSPQPKLKV